MPTRTSDLMLHRSVSAIRLVIHILIRIYVYIIDFLLLNDFFGCHGVLVDQRNGLTVAGPMGRRIDVFRLSRFGARTILSVI